MEAYQNAWYPPSKVTLRARDNLSKFLRTCTRWSACIPFAMSGSVTNTLQLSNLVRDD